MPLARPTCGNPLFLSWMEESRDEAKGKSSKAAETYAKACKSIQACPVTYARPRELVALKGIGPKIADGLEQRYKKHCEENGILFPASPEKPKVDKGKTRSLSPNSTALLSDLEADEEALAKKTKKRKAPAAPKRYIPQRGSGGYGILLSLILAIDQPDLNTQVFLTRSEVIRGAKGYCDSSYDHSEKGSYFTAWSSMKALVNRGYVYVTGNPHKYCLTEEGYEVACAIRSLRPELEVAETRPFLHDPADGLRQAGLPAPKAALPLAPGQSNQASVGPSPLRSLSVASMATTIAGRPKAEKFHFWYIDPSGSRTSSLDSAMVRLDPVDFINIRKIEFLFAQRSHPFTAQLVLVDAQAKRRESSGYLTFFGYIVEEGAPPLCSKFDDRASAISGASTEGTRGPQIDADSHWEDDENLLAPPSTTALPARTPISVDLEHDNKSVTTFARTESAPAGPSVSSTLIAEATLRRLKASANPELSRTQSASADFSLPSKSARPAPRLSSHVPVSTPLLDEDDTLGVEPDKNVPDFQQSAALIFPANSFEVVLILDTREVESKTNRDRIAEALEDKGVKVETRALRLGDVCWIARRLDGLGGEEDECVLDYVVERKRLDDLCNSIKDGRYNEQCFRLTNSCINKVFYIVEDWQVNHSMESSALQVMTAKSQIQLHNRFFLKETHKLSETIDFLALMTDVITSSLSSKEVAVVPTRFLSRSSYAALQGHLRKTYPDQSFLTSFQAYQELNDKSASKTLREVFGRMLMCIKGVSAERVSAVLDEWDTPHALWEGMKRHDGIELVEDDTQAKKKKRGKDVFFADKIRGDGRRMIGDALSQTLWRAFMGDEPVS